ncbi:hypothetical protein PAMP_023723 [Pampus punctatissimus]
MDPNSPVRSKHMDFTERKLWIRGLIKRRRATASVEGMPTSDIKECNHGRREGGRRRGGEEGRSLTPSVPVLQVKLTYWAQANQQRIT